jgi:hypothetical protein
MGWLSKLGPKLAPEPSPEQAEAARKAAEVAAVPPGVSRAELDQILGDRFNAVLEQVSQIAGRPVQVQLPPMQYAQPPHVEPEISDDDLDRALLAGPGAAGTIRKLVQREATKLANQVITQHIDPLRQTGLGAISNLVTEHAAATLPFYRKFKDAIDARVSQLTADQQVNPLAIKLVHDTIVGENWQVVAEEVLEQRTRQAAEKGAAAGMPGSTPHATRGNDDVNLEDFGGKAAMRALEFKDGGAQDLDTFAKKLGYKSFKEYASVMPALDAQYKQ